MDSDPSKPSALLKSSTLAASDISRTKETKDRKFREEMKKAKIVFEDEGREFRPEPTDMAGLSERLEIATTLSKRRIDEILRSILRAHDVQLCFLVDVTGSMQSHIDEVRASIIFIVKTLTDPPGTGKTARPEAQSMEIAFVAYRDIGDTNQYEVLPFTSSIAEFKDFCGPLRATGGADEAEDVFGGLHNALNLSWSANCGTKVIFHICDAPCHGKEFHRPGTGDTYPDGDPNGRTCKELFTTLHLKGIQYHFGKINDSTNVMIQKFSEAYGDSIDEFDVKNVVNIRESVIMAVRKSISTSVSLSKRTVGVKRAVREVTLEKAEPVWSTLAEVKGSLMSYELPKSIKDIVDAEPLKARDRKKAIVKIASNPFGKGADRFAYYGKDLSEYVNESGGKKSTSKSAETEIKVLKKDEDIVLKEYLHVGKGMNTAKRYELFNQMQTVASYLAREFIKDLKNRMGISKEIKFIKIKTLYVRSEPARYMTYEKRFAATDTFVRFTNNTDYSIMDEKALKLGVSVEFVELVIAFSHWTYKATNRFLMVVDLEGVVSRIGGDGETGVLLTDPAIHCEDLNRYKPMNHGPGGMKNFFASHVCNQFCKGLGLEDFVA